MYFDWTYFVLVLPCLIFSLWASYSVRSTFQKYSSQRSIRGITGAQAAERVLRHNGVSGVSIERINGSLTDHYDPTANVIRLSDSVFNNTSTAAIGVACHEAGHAVQYAKAYLPIKIRAAIIPITSIGSKAAIPLILIGVAIGYMGGFLVNLGMACFGLSVIFQLITLPVEFNASRRAMKAIVDTGILTEEEQKGARKTLTAAAMTYVAAMASSLANFIRLRALYGNNRRSRY